MKIHTPVLFPVTDRQLFYLNFLYPRPFFQARQMGAPQGHVKSIRKKRNPLRCNGIARQGRSPFFKGWPLRGHDFLGGYACLETRTAISIQKEKSSGVGRRSMRSREIVSRAFLTSEFLLRLAIPLTPKPEGRQTTRDNGISPPWKLSLHPRNPSSKRRADTVPGPSIEGLRISTPRGKAPTLANAR